MIRHILLIAFNDATTTAQKASVKRAFLAIPAGIEGVESVEWGCNNSPEGKNAGFTHCVVMTFRDEAARQHYLPHPEHEKLKLIFRPVLQDIIVVDYSVTKDGSA